MLARHLQVEVQAIHRGRSGENSPAMTSGNTRRRVGLPRTAQRGGLRAANASYGATNASVVSVPRSLYEWPIDGGMATEALIVHVVVSKFCDGLPLYRQSQMLSRQGVTLGRSTLSNWVGRACWWLTPLYELIVGTALAVTKLLADDTTLPVLDPGRGRTKTGRLWLCGRRPTMAGESHPATRRSPLPGRPWRAGAPEHQLSAASVIKLTPSAHFMAVC